MAEDGRYVRFEPKIDDANEVISAEHINTLQDTSERTQQGLFKAQDRDFLDKALFVLEHHRGVNGLWLDLFEDISKINLPRSLNLVFSEVEQGIVFPDGSEQTDGYLYSTTYQNPNFSNMKKVMVIALGYQPPGTSITIEVSNNEADWLAIPLSDSNLFELPSDGTSLTMRAVFNRSDASVASPRLDSWAMLYYDVKSDIIQMPDGSQVIIADPTDPTGLPDMVQIMHHQLMGIGPNDHHPQSHTHDGTDGSGLVSHNSLTEVGPDDHHPKSHYHGEDGIPYVRLGSDVTGTLPVENLSYQLWTGKPGTTGLYFDPKLNDRLTYVKTPDDETYMFYDLVNDRLDHTIMVVQGVASWEQMIYGEYVNSLGETNTILQGTEKHLYDAKDPAIRAEIDKMTAPSAPLGLMVSDAGLGGTLNLLWTPNTELDLVGYNVYRSTDGGIIWVLLNITGIVSANAYVVTGLPNGVPSLFSVTSVDETPYESTRSIAVSGTPTLADTIAPNPPQNIVAIAMGGGVIGVAWNENTESDLDHYKVYRSYSGAAGTFTIVQTAPAGTTSVSNSGLLTGNTYFYYVTAVDLSGNESVPSIIVSTNA